MTSQWPQEQAEGVKWNWVCIPSLQRTSFVTLYKLTNLSVPLFPHLENGNNNSTTLTRLSWALKETSTEYVLSCIEYYYEYYYFTPQRTQLNTIIWVETEPHFCGWAQTIGHPSSIQSLQQLFIKHLLCDKKSYHFHPGCQGATWKGGAPSVSAQVNGHCQTGHPPLHDG